MPVVEVAIDVGSRIWQHVFNDADHQSVVLDQAPRRAGSSAFGQSRVETLNGASQ